MRNRVGDFVEMSENLDTAFGFDKVTKRHSIGDGIRWRYYKHWAQNVWAGEGRYKVDGDRSGCLYDDGLGCSRPLVFLARLYKKGRKEISALLSYPNGIGAVDTYFWEILPTRGFKGYYNCERFTSEVRMERRIRQLMLK